MIQRLVQLDCLIKSWKFQHKTWSPNFSRANRLTEGFVETAKCILKKCTHDNTDTYLGLMNYHNIPHNETLRSPNQQLTSKITRSIIPTGIKLLKHQFKKIVSEEVTRLRKIKKIMLINARNNILKLHIIWDNQQENNNRRR